FHLSLIIRLRVSVAHFPLFYDIPKIFDAITAKNPPRRPEPALVARLIFPDFLMAPFSLKCMSS
ncbi:MAG TPA: hypothetical protein VMW20_04670, partial [Candidatus Nanoarchaeia archaeon]|nr:hypothetical protein [Candidatus Nanoarchaeia archaeon]